MYQVYLVDDDELILKQIATKVPWMENGFEVIGMEADSKSALEQVLQLRPDVVFTDLSMPQLDGHSFMRAVRETGCQTQFVMLSAYGTFEDARTFFQQEGFDYLLKPLQPQEVQMVLEKLAGKLAAMSPANSPLEDGVQNPAFLELLNYLKNHYMEKYSLEQLSRRFGLSPGYICNLFAKSNTTLTCYVTKIRMERAKELTDQDQGLLKSIAVECGYKDYFYFNKVFKGYYGITPGQYLTQKTLQ